MGNLYNLGSVFTKFTDSKTNRWSLSWTLAPKRCSVSPIIVKKFHLPQSPILSLPIMRLNLMPKAGLWRNVNRFRVSGKTSGFMFSIKDLLIIQEKAMAGVGSQSASNLVGRWELHFLHKATELKKRLL